VVSGRAHVRGGTFPSFYYNSETGTQAFALVKGSRRVWGVDYDNIRGWHMHPAAEPEQHVPISPQSVPEIIRQFGHALTGEPGPAE
jgi:hypothetical protein